ncbi:terminase large subunit domain-containing protein [Rhizobium mongolense]|uniref:Terminase family protein n=2 Tax=Rhizobium mongolense TaxID=57676 RepID=A0ABR6IQ64_9HYPH|nr:terminase family protein [Rhizobium mongolense]MBB4230036.1 hypothetical protein [Rhizobium mongolense]TVZ72832.1 terminase family protein [Rhizobium mongolense USDA 1844]
MANITSQQKQSLLAAFKKDPQFFATTVFGEENALRPKQVEFFEKFLAHDHITFKGGVGFGKTRVMAILVWWALFCFNDVKVNIFGPSEGQIQDNLWNEVGILYGLMPEVFKEQFEYAASRAFRIGSRNECFATYSAANKDNLGTVRGIHATNNFVLVDEAADVPNEVFMNLENIMSDKNPKLVLISNPAKTTGFFYDTWEHPEINKAWAKVHGRMSDNPNMMPEKLEAFTALYGGKGSRQYRIMVEGEFPLDEVDGVISREHVIAAIENPDVFTPKDAPVVWGLDPNGGGDDRSTLVMRKDNRIIGIKEFPGFDAVQLANAIHSEFYSITNLADRPVEICVDANGPGYGPWNMLHNMGGLPIKKCMSQHSPTRDPLLYFNTRAQMWWEMRKWFAEGGVCIPNHPDLVMELCLPLYEYNAKNKILIESKKDIRKRGKRSPDFADALALTFLSNKTNVAGRFAWSKTIEYDVRCYE